MNHAIAATAALLLSVCAPSPAADLPVAEIRGLFADCCGAGSPSASVLVVSNGKPIFRESFGFANLEQNIQATPKTNYRLASVTKQFTAMAIMMLVDRGRLKPDQTLSEFFPELPQWAQAITVRHLLNHTSGIPGYASPRDAKPPAQVTPADQLKDRDVIGILQSKQQPDFEAGARFAYSNSGYVVLALIVEKASGIGFAEFLEKNIFRPLKMNATVAHREGISVIKNRAFGYMKEQGKWVRRDQSVASALLGDGGVYSSLGDLAKWDKALSKGRLVKPELWRAAISSGLLRDGSPIQIKARTGPPSGYGFGWELAEFDGTAVHRHGGASIGFGSFILRIPERRLTVVVLQNRLDLSPGDAAHKIAELVLRSR